MERKKTKATMKGGQRGEKKGGGTRPRPTVLILDGKRPSPTSGTGDSGV